MQYEQYEHPDQDEPMHPGMMPNGYEEEGGTRMLATSCLICDHPLRDPASLERGVGPICAAKHGMFAVTGAPDMAALGRALETAPPLMAAAIREREGDPRKAVSAAIHAAGRAWETHASDYAYYIGSAMEIASALGFAGTARALQAVFVEGRKFDEEGNPVGKQKPQGIVVTAVQGGQWEIELPLIESKNVWFETNNAMKAAGSRNQKDQRGRWHTTFPGNDVQWIKILNALVPTLAGTLGVLPSGETFIVPADRQAVPQPATAQAPAGAGPEGAVQQEPGRLPKDAASLEAGDTVYLKGKPMVVAWVSPDRVRTILLTPENAARSMKEKGFLHGKQFGGITAGMRDVVVTPPTTAEVAQVAETTDKPAGRAAAEREMPEQLMAHQREGVLWLCQQGSGLLAYDMGLGKTAIAIVAADYPALVVCPKSLKANWVKEVTMWRPDLTAVAVETGKKREAASLAAAERADVTVVNYDILSRYVEQFQARKFKTLIVDESHYIKNFRIGPRKNEKTGQWRTVPTGSARAIAVWEVAQSIPRRALLSGTPMSNKSPCEMFGQLHLVAPDEFPKFKPFGERYCDPQQIRAQGRNITTYEGASNILELHERINGKYMLRKTKDILNLPEKWRRTKLISLDDATAKEYEAAASDLFAFIRARGGWEAMERAERAEVLVRMNTLSHLTGVGKVEAFLEEVQQHWESTRRPLLIFAQHVDVQHALLNALKALNYRVGSILGGDEDREATKERFQEGVPVSAPPEQRDYYDILVLSIEAAGVGLTLTRAQDVFFIERTWTPSKLAQAEDRVHRIGQKNQVTITYFDAPGTLDEKFGEMLMKKLATAKGVMEGVVLSQEDVAAGIFGSITGGGMKPNQRGGAESYPDWIEPT
jgi:hypothetical protein